MVNLNLADTVSTPNPDDKLPERKLWLAVLGAAASDAVNDSWWTTDGQFRSKAKRSADQEYFLSPTRNFFKVCEYAGLDAEYVQRKMKRALKCLEK